MDTKKIIILFNNHKYKIIINIILTVLLSFFIFTNLNLSSKKTRMIIYFSYNSYSDMFINEIGLINFNVKEKFTQKIKSYKNFNIWINSQKNKDLINIKYEDILRFNFEEDTVVITELHKLGKNSSTSDEIINYFEHTTLHINYIFNHLSKIYFLKNEIKSITTTCDKMFTIYLKPNISAVINNELIKIEDIKKCLDNKYKNKDILESEYKSLMNELFVIDHIKSVPIENIDSYNKAIKIHDINYEEIYLNNIEAFNFYVFTAFMLLLTLTIQYGIIFFLPKKD